MGAMEDQNGRKGIPNLPSIASFVLPWRPSRRSFLSMTEFFGVGLALASERFAQLVRLIGVEVQPEQHVVGDARESRHAAVPCREGRFQRCDRKGAALGYFQRHVK